MNTTQSHAPTPERALARWYLLARDMAHPDVELDVETFAPIAATFEQLRRQGRQFDPMLVALIATLKAQAFNTDSGLEDNDEHQEHDTGDPGDADPRAELPPTGHHLLARCTDRGEPVLPVPGARKVFAVKVTTDHMAPEYLPGDVVLFNEGLEPKDGDACFVRLPEKDTAFAYVFFEPGIGGPSVRLQPGNLKQRARTVPLDLVHSVAPAYHVRRAVARKGTA